MLPEDMKSLSDNIEDLKKIKDGTDTEAIKKKLEEMNQLAQTIGAKMYSQQQANPSSAPGATAAKRVLVFRARNK